MAEIIYIGRYPESKAAHNGTNSRTTAVVIVLKSADQLLNSKVRLRLTEPTLATCVMARRAVQLVVESDVLVQEWKNQFIGSFASAGEVQDIWRMRDEGADVENHLIQKVHKHSHA